MAPKKELVLKLSSMRYKKTGVSEERFHEYTSKLHGPQAAVIQARHGALKVAQYHTPKSMRNLIEEKLPWALRPGFQIDDHDCTINVWVRRPEDMIAIVTDPDFQALISGDDEVIDNSKATIAAGWEEVYVEDGKVVNLEHGESIYPSFAECEKFATEGKRTTAPADLTF